MIGEKAVLSALKYATDVSRIEIKYIKKTFKAMDRILRLKEEEQAETDEEKKRTCIGAIKINFHQVGYYLINLISYDITYETLVKYTNEKKYQPLLIEAYEYNKDLIDKWDREGARYLRLSEKNTHSLREAKKDLKEFMADARKTTSAAARLFLSDEVDEASEEAVYSLRDWLIEDFDALIDKIEPVRQEYIISKKGKVKPEEVEYMLMKTFPEEYKGYANWLIQRPGTSIVYYPGLRI